MSIRHAAAAAAILAATAVPASSEVVGKVGVDWVGNDIVVEAVTDPAVKGVTCHVTYFDRSIIDRLSNGNWFEDHRTTRSPAGRRDRSKSVISIFRKKERRVFREGLSIIWKSLVVNRIYDKKNDTLIYLVHSRQVVEGSREMAISTVPLFNQAVVWTKGKPQ